MDAIPIGFKESIPLAGSTGIGTAESKHEEREQYSLVGSGRGLSPDEFVVEKSSREFYEKNNKKIGKCYPVDLSKKRGQVLIINMNTFDNGSPRQGSERDVLNLKRLFEELNFIVTVECNLSKKDLKNAINLFSQDEKHREYSCCFVFLLSHGAPMYSGSIDGQWGIVCRDGNEIDVEKDVINKFSNQEAQHLIGKPKFIIINACRGFSPDYANFVAEDLVLQGCGEDYKVSVQIIRPYRSVADIAIVKSSVPGYASIRNKSRGTWCIETLCEEFRSKAWNKDVLTLFQLTDEALSRKIGDDDEMQTLEITIRGLNKKLYLYPGL